MMDLSNCLEEVPAAVDVLYLYGFPSNEQRDLILKWLARSESRMAVIIEEREETFLILNFSLGNNPQVRLLSPQMITEEEIKQVCWEVCLKKATFLFAEDCSPERQREGSEFFAKIAHYQRGIDMLASDYSDLGVCIARNTFANFSYLARAKNGLSLKRAFHNVPAIICGAGPSLVSELNMFPDARQKALVLAGGSAMQALGARSFLPHFAAGIDPDPPYERFFDQPAFEVPFFYQSRLSERLLPLAQGELIWLPDNGGWGWEKMLLGEMGDFDGGWTVGTFCTALAVHLGCNPILFWGLDLSFQKERYADGVTHAIQEELIEVKGNSGERLLSKKDWVLSAEWISECAKKNPQTTFWNASKGLALEGVKNFTIAEALQRLESKEDLDGKVHTQLQLVKTIQMPLKEMHSKMKAVHEGIRRIEKQCDRLLEICQELHPKPPFDHGPYVLLEMDLEDDAFYQKLFLPIWQVWQHLLRRSSPYPLEAHLNRWLFLKRICQEHLMVLRKFSYE